MLAKVILCKCGAKHTFGIRIEKRGDDWVRTWAFKIDAESAKREGFEKARVKGSFQAVGQYPGCPYCGRDHLCFCSCGGVNCASESDDSNDDGSVKRTCNWCGKTGYYNTVAAEALTEADAGGM